MRCSKRNQVSEKPEMDRNVLSPSILAADFSILGEEIRKAQEAGAQYLHIDVMDGVFVPNISMGIPVVKSLRNRFDLFFDVHLMIEDPLRFVRPFAAAGADSITFHLESTDDPGAVITAIRDCRKKAGIALRADTDLSLTEQYLPFADTLLLMSVEPGFDGQKFMDSSLERIREAKNFITSKGLHTAIEVDGGINRYNVKSVIRAGADIIVAGSAVFRGDIQSNTQFFMKAMERKSLPSSVDGCETFIKFNSV